MLRGGDWRFSWGRDERVYDMDVFSFGICAGAKKGRGRGWGVEGRKLTKRLHRFKNKDGGKCTCFWSIRFPLLFFSRLGGEREGERGRERE